MILENLIIPTTDDNLQTSALDIQLVAPNNLGISTCLSGITATGTPFTAFAGISGGTLQGGDTFGVAGSFNSGAVLFIDNVVEVTFVVGAQAAPGGLFTGSNTLIVSGICQVIFDTGI